MAIKEGNTTITQINYERPSHVLVEDAIKLVYLENESGPDTCIWAHPYNYTIVSGGLSHISTIEAKRAFTLEPIASTGTVNTGTGTIFYSDELYWNLTPDPGWSASWTYNSSSNTLFVEDNVTLTASLINLTTTKIAYKYYTGTLPTGVASLTAKVSRDGSSYTTLNNGATIYIGDKIYWTVTATTGYKVTVVYGSSSNYYTVGASDVTGTSTAGLNITYQTYQITYNVYNCDKTAGTQTTSYTFNPSSAQSCTVGRYTGHTGYYNPTPTANNGCTIEERGSEYYVSIPAGTTGTITVTASPARISWSYSIGTLPSGVDAFYTYRQKWNSSTGWTGISNGSTVEYGDKLYFIAQAKEGWDVSYDYQGPTDYYTTTYNITGVAASSLTSSGKTYNITYTCSTHAYAYSGDLTYSYTVKAVVDSYPIADWRGRTGYNADTPTANNGCSVGWRGQDSQWGVNIPAYTYGDIVITITATPIVYSISYNTGTGLTLSNQPTSYTIESSGTYTVAVTRANGYTLSTVTSSNSTAVSVTKNSDTQFTVTINSGNTGNVTITPASTYRTYNITYNLTNVTRDISSGTTYTYNPGDQLVLAGQFYGTTGYSANTPTVNNGCAMVSASGGYNISIPGGTYGNITVTCTGSRLAYNYTTGSKTGVASITCYRCPWDGSSYAVISNNTTIYYGDKLYWAVTSATGYTASVPNYYDSSHYLTVTGNVTGANYVSASANTYNIIYSIGANTSKTGGSQTTSYTYWESQQEVTIGNYGADTGYWLNGPNTSAGSISSQSGDHYLHIPAGQTGTITISTSATRCNYTYYTGTMPTGGSSLTAYVQRWNASSGWSVLSNNSTIYYGDKIYWSPAASTGYYVYNNTYYDGSHYYTVGYADVTGVTTTNFQCRPNTYTISYSIGSNTYKSSGSQTTSYTYSSSQQQVTIGNYSANTGYWLNGPSTNAGTISSQSGDHYLHIPAGQTGTITISTSATRISATYYTGTLPTGISSITAYRQLWNGSGFNSISNGTTIYYGDKIYFSATASTGYTANCNPGSSSAALTVTTSNITGASYVSASYASYTISYTNTNVTHKSSYVTSYSYNPDSGQVLRVGYWTANSGYAISSRTSTQGTVSEAPQFGTSPMEYGLTIPAGTTGSITVTCTATVAAQSVTIKWDHNENYAIFQWVSYTGAKPQSITGNATGTATATGQTFKCFTYNLVATVKWNNGTTSTIYPKTSNHNNQTFYK